MHGHETQAAPVYGVTAVFATPADVYYAAEQVRDAGYTKWDVYSPFPIHGIEEAMGMPRTKLPLLVGLGAATGVGLGYLLQYWVTHVAYQMVVQGKPTQAWEGFIPITFEIGVLLASFTTLIGMLALNGLPRHHHPLFAKDRFLKVSDDTFMICIEADDPKFDRARAEQLLRAAGGRDVDVVTDED